MNPRSADGVADHDRGVYTIAVVAELTGVSVQTLRLYEARGLIDPARTGGGTRRYSASDVHTLRRVIALLAEGVNLAGARRIITLEDELRTARDSEDRRPSPRDR